MSEDVVQVRANRLSTFGGRAECPDAQACLRRSAVFGSAAIVLAGPTIVQRPKVIVLDYLARIVSLTLSIWALPIPAANWIANSVTRLPWKRAAPSAVSSGLRVPLLLMNEAPYGLPALNWMGSAYPGPTIIPPQ